MYELMLKIEKRKISLKIGTHLYLNIVSYYSFIIFNLMSLSILKTYYETLVNILSITIVVYKLINTGWNDKIN